MNDKNFDSLKNLKAPDSWIENAMNIPKIQEKKPIFFIRYSRSLAAVACLVLVCTISLLVVLNKGDGSVLVVDPDFETTVKDVTENTTSESVAQTDSLTDAQNDKNDKKKPVDKTGNTNGSAPHESTEEAEKPTDSQDKKPVKPTDKPVVKPTAPTDKEEKPTDPPETLPVPTVRPTRPPNSKPPIKPVNRPNTPGDPMTPPPTEGDPSTPGKPGSPGVPSVPSQDITFSIVVDEYFLTSSEKILCAIIDPDNNELYSELTAYVYRKGSSVLASVSLETNELTLTGEYTCYFYSSNGYYIGSDRSYVE